MEGLSQLEFKKKVLLLDEKALPLTSSSDTRGYLLMGDKLLDILFNDIGEYFQTILSDIYVMKESDTV